MWKGRIKVRLNDLSPAKASRRVRQRVGRGASAGKGKTCGRGHKGQNCRSGGGVRPGFEGGQQPLQRRLPAFGFRSPKALITGEIRLSELARVDGDAVDMESLRRAGLLSLATKRVKIIQSGSITRAVHVKGIRVTAGARQAIEANGGSVTS